MVVYDSLEQFLSSRLSVRGDLPLPYNEKDKYVIRSHLVELSKEFPTLRVNEEEHVEISGQRTSILFLKGTQPMIYMGYNFNIPIKIYLPRLYPHKSPLVFVNPTDDMIIKPGHSYVDQNTGQVVTDFLGDWTSPRSDLVGLCHDLMIVFGQEPPVFQKPPGWQPPQKQNEQQINLEKQKEQNQIDEIEKQRSKQSSPSLARVETIKNQNAPKIVEDLSKKFRSIAEASLTLRLQQTIKEYLDENQQELNNLSETMESLKFGEKQILQGLEQLNKEKKQLQEHTQIFINLDENLQDWIQNSEFKTQLWNQIEKIDPDELIVAGNDFSQTILDCASVDSAIENCFVALEKGLNREIFSLDEYVRVVRELSRKQFNPRALRIQILNERINQSVGNNSLRSSQQSEKSGFQPIVRNTSWNQYRQKAMRRVASLRT